MNEFDKLVGWLEEKFNAVHGKLDQLIHDDVAPALDEVGVVAARLAAQALPVVLEAAEGKIGTAMSSVVCSLHGVTHETGPCQGSTTK